MVRRLITKKKTSESLLFFNVKNKSESWISKDCSIQYPLEIQGEAV